MPVGHYKTKNPHCVSESQLLARKFVPFDRFCALEWLSEVNLSGKSNTLVCLQLQNVVIICEPFSDLFKWNYQVRNEIGTLVCVHPKELRFLSSKIFIFMYTYNFLLAFLLLWDKKEMFFQIGHINGVFVILPLLSNCFNFRL